MSNILLKTRSWDLKLIFTEMFFPVRASKAIINIQCFNTLHTKWTKDNGLDPKLQEWNFPSFLSLCNPQHLKLRSWRLRCKYNLKDYLFKSFKKLKWLAVQSLNWDWQANWKLVLPRLFAYHSGKQWVLPSSWEARQKLIVPSLICLLLNGKQ